MWFMRSVLGLTVAWLIGGMNLTVAAETMPTEVQQFLARRAHCDHARGEEAYDEERRQQLLLMQCRYCWHTDRQLAQLRSKYAQDVNIIAKLAALERTVEDQASQTQCRNLARSGNKRQSQQP